MPVRTPPTRKCILVADDDPIVRELWADALRQAGHRVVEASDGLEAVTAMRFLLPDLVVLDLRMPHLTGQEVLALVRASPVVGRVPVLVVSGHLAAESAGGDLGLRILDRLEKPVVVSELVARVRTALESETPRLPGPPDLPTRAS
jgi:CheY-like chemotaxis protein